MAYIVFVLALISPVWSQANQSTDVFSGSGYAAVEGSVINYTYNNFGGFYLTVQNHKLRWEGFHGYFYGLVSSNAPQISEVAPGVFLFSWQTQGSGSDNVVQNFNTSRVTAHLQPNEGRGGAIQMIHGVVHCRNTPECGAPSQVLTPKTEIGPPMMSTIKEFGFPPLFDPAVNNSPRASADIQAREELAGQAIVYATPEGEFRIEVAGDTTRVSVAGQPSQSYQTYASKLADNLYFVSWMDGPGGSHVVINKATGKVYDHLLPDGTRRESVFDLDCFDLQEDC